MENAHLPKSEDDSIQKYLDEIERFPPIDSQEEIHLERLIRKARRELAEPNLRLVVSIAKKYMGHGVSLLDLIQEGNVCLFRAIDTFDPELGMTLWAHAEPYITGVCEGLISKTRSPSGQSQ